MEGARGLDLYTNLITSGIPCTRERLARLQACGLDNVQVSVQDVRADGMVAVVTRRGKNRLGGSALAQVFEAIGDRATVVG